MTRTLVDASLVARLARFAGKGEPRHVFDRIEDCSVIHPLVRCTPTVSPRHRPSRRP